MISIFYFFLSHHIPSLSHPLGNFPYTISMRYEDESVLVFDDLLSLTPAHLNVIPTNQYIPDWRYLCNNPRLG